MRRPKIVQIGFNKCATRSLAMLMEQNGLPVADWQRGKLAVRCYKRMMKGEDPFADYPETVWFSDMEMTDSIFWHNIEFYKEYEYIWRHHPDAYYVLNTRNKADWLKSRINHKNYLLYYRRFYRTFSRQKVIERWSEEWDLHHAAVLAFFADKPGRLCIYDIDMDKPEKLAAFVAPHYKLENLTMPRRGDTEARRTQSKWFRRPGWVKPWMWKWAVRGR